MAVFSWLLAFLGQLLIFVILKSSLAIPCKFCIIRTWEVWMSEKLLIFIGIFGQFIEPMNKMRVTQHLKGRFLYSSLYQQKDRMYFWSLELLYFIKSWSKIIVIRSTSWIVHENKTWLWTGSYGWPLCGSKLSFVLLQKEKSCSEVEGFSKYRKSSHKHPCV